MTNQYYIWHQTHNKPSSKPMMSWFMIYLSLNIELLENNTNEGEQTTAVSSACNKTIFPVAIFI